MADADPEEDTGSYVWLIQRQHKDKGQAPDTEEGFKSIPYVTSASLALHREWWSLPTVKSVIVKINTFT